MLKDFHFHSENKRRWKQTSNTPNRELLEILLNKSIFAESCWIPSVMLLFPVLCFDCRLEKNSELTSDWCFKLSPFIWGIGSQHYCLVTASNELMSVSFPDYLAHFQREIHHRRSRTIFTFYSMLHFESPVSTWSFLSACLDAPGSPVEASVSCSNSDQLWSWLRPH